MPQDPETPHPLPGPRGPAARPPLPPLPSLPDHFSYSAMTLFQACPRRWSYQYLWQFPPEFTTGSLLMGRGVHAAVELIHHARLAGRDLGAEEALRAFDGVWPTEAGVPEVRYARDESRERLRDGARGLLELYLARHLPPPESVLGVEEQVVLQVPGVCVPVTGRLDLLLREGEDLVVADVKTSRNGFDAEKARQSTVQLALYASALAPAARQWAGRLKGRFLVFRKLKTPRIERLEVELGREDLARPYEMLRLTWSLIEAAHACGAFPPNPNWQCKGCPFRERCAKEGLVAAQAAWDAAQAASFHEP